MISYNLIEICKRENAINLCNLYCSNAIERLDSEGKIGGDLMRLFFAGYTLQAYLHSRTLQYIKVLRQHIAIFLVLVECRGFEPLTSTLPALRSPN